MLEVAMDLATVARLGHLYAIHHDARPVIPCKTNDVIHLWPALMPAADSMMHLLQYLVSFLPVDATKKDLLSMGMPVKDT
jgi:hypothetical protein